MDFGKPLVNTELKLPLNPPPPSPCAEDDNPTTPTGAASYSSSDGSSSSSSASAVALSILGLNSVIAIYRSRHDPRSILFVSACFFCVVLLFHLLRVFERLPPPPSPRARRLQVKAAVWALTTTLTVMFSGRVAPLMPAPVAAIVWSMAAVTILAGFYMFFVWPDARAAGSTDDDDDEKPACIVVEGP